MPEDWITLATRLLAAALFGLVLGFERQWRGHDAGIRTHAIVALSSATIMLSSLLLLDDMARHGGSGDPLRAVQGLAQAIGFIAGGLIFVRGGDVRNMTTAVSLWMAAAGGIAAGAGQWRLLVIATIIALALLCLDRLVGRFVPKLKHRADIDGAPQEGMPNRRGGTRETIDRHED